VSRRWATTPRGRLSGSDLRGLLGPTPVTVDEAEFDRLEEEGELFESHEDLFTHPLIVHKHGVSLTDVQAVVSKGEGQCFEGGGGGSSVQEVAAGRRQQEEMVFVRGCALSELPQQE
jgi:hypothetical protein